MKKSREEQLQFLRFLAFSNIFLLHSSDWLWFRYPFWNGAVSAVSFFIILSGAMAGYSGYHKTQELSLRSVGRDMWKKVRRMYPLYFLSLFFSTFYSGLPGLLINHDLAGAKPMLQELARHLLLLQSWFPEGYFSYNGVGWYLSTVMFLYLFNIPMTALLKRIEKKPHAGWWYTGILLGCGMGTALYSYVTYSGDAHFLQYIFPPARIGQYISGMVLGYAICAWKEKNSKGSKTSMGFTAAEITALIFWFGSLLFSDESWRNRLVDWMLPNLLLIGIFLLGQGGVSALFRWKPLVRLGDISFECYLIHQILIRVFSILSSVQPDTKLGCLLCVGMCFGFTLLLAFYLNQSSRKTGTLSS